MIVGDFIYSIGIIFFTFSASTITVGILSYYNNKPFFNPTNKSSPFIIIPAITCNYLILNNFIHPIQHNIMVNSLNIVSYSIVVEFIYYVYHRIVHMKRFYKKIHSAHHENIEVYPMDAFHMTNIDATILVIILGAPCAFIKMNHLEYFLSLYIYLTAVYLEHTEFLLTHHAKHHKLLFCNYCILNPFFDILGGTHSPLIHN